jgi:2-succinyl-5-enolpyruvyl-6-hydroxy-3-cyclohexene-1-carboxylate synthase
VKIEELLNFFKELGVKHVVCSPGGRCKDLLLAFSRSKDFKVTTLYDERSSSFYALGCSFTEPTVVLTTSGTAATELFSAMAESYHQKSSKIIALTADRPIELRDSGAPQTINQKKLFERFSRVSLDLTHDVSELKYIAQKTKHESIYPMHINVCLKEPNPLKAETSNLNCGPLVVVSELDKDARAKVKEALKDYSGALVLEPLSNLKPSDFQKSLHLPFAESFIASKKLDSFSSIYRLGGVPVLKAWREVERFKSFYWSEVTDFSGGLGVKSLSLLKIKEQLLKEMKNLGDIGLTKKEVSEYSDKVFKLMDQCSNSEVSLLNTLSKLIEQEDEVFIGNSLPVREWDFVQNKNYNVFGQRGVNGIDGSLAFALGRLSLDKVNWIVLGDLTSLYNFNDFQILEKLKNSNVRIVVVNNGGGQIFSKVIKKDSDVFLNAHTKSFQSIADFWGLNYISGLKNVKNLLDSKASLNQSPSLIELKPDSLESETFWKELSLI